MKLFLRSYLVAFSLLPVSVASAQPIPRRIVATGETLTLPVTNASSVRLQLRDLAGTVLDDERKSVKNGQITSGLDVEPGQYDLQIVTDDQNRSPLGVAIPVLVPGLRREAGRWLLNGSIFYNEAKEQSHQISAAANLPSTPFLQGLRRDDKAKLPRNLALPIQGEFSWKTLPVRDDLSAMLKPNYDWNNLRTTLKADVDEARARGDLLVGISASEKTEVADLKLGEDDLVPVWGKLKAIVREVAPEAALLLEVDTQSIPTASYVINQVGPLADAIVIDGQIPHAIWPIKVARRNAEDQKDYDLPIIVRVGNVTPASALEAFQSGASGIILSGANSSDFASLEAAFDRNNFLLSGAVTLEDAGLVLPSNPTNLPLEHELRLAGRLPLLARLYGDEKKRAESFLTVFDDSTRPETLEAIKKGATAGATIYVEGLPRRDLWQEWADITGTTVDPTSSTNTYLTLSEPWFWGTANGQDFSVTQDAKIGIHASIAAQTREKKGEAIETEARPIARLAQDPNGLMLCPVGKGRILWMPHRFAASVDAEKRVDYYDAIAGDMGAALVMLRGPSAATVRAHLRASQGATAILSLFNQGAANTVDVTMRGTAHYALDLLTNREMPTTVRGYETHFSITLPENGFAWIALSDTSDTLNKERKANARKAKLK